MSIELTGEAAFDNVMERLLEERAAITRLRHELTEMRQLAESRRMELVTAKAEKERAVRDINAVRDNYEALKKMVPAKILDAHNKAIDDIPF